MNKGVILAIIFTVFLSCFFGYKLLDVPRGLTLDEASFGYNAALLAQTARDENGRFLPLFVLSSGGKDWRQPVTQYYLTGLFRVFGSSVFLLRFSSVIIVVGSIIALYFFTKSLLGIVGAVAASGVMAMTPAIMIQSHMALDNIMPIPFTIFWLWLMKAYLRYRENKWVMAIGIVLGMSLYTYKGMRPVVLIWLVLSALMLLVEARSVREALKKWMCLGISVAPFFLAIPLIEKYYPGAMMGGTKIVFNNVYEFLQPYLSSFDISYLFVSGDLLSIHSTGIHGMYLLASAPWFVLGIYRVIRKGERFWIYLLLAFFFGPLFFGLVGSVHRFSRLMMMVPLYSLVCGFGVSWVWSQKSQVWKLVVMGGLLIMVINFGDFLRSYRKTYPGVTESITGTMNYYKDFERLAKVSADRNSEAVIHEQVAGGTGESGKFFQIIYFGKLLRVVSDESPPKTGEVLISPRDEIEGSKVIPGAVQFDIFVPKD